jgi:hypothetical protein
MRKIQISGGLNKIFAGNILSKGSIKIAVAEQRTHIKQKPNKTKEG